MSDLSIEQAALAAARHASELDELPAPWGSVLKALEAGERLNAGRWEYAQALGTEITELHDEMAELRDAILALSNRIEAVTRRRKDDGTFACTLAGGGCNVGHPHLHDEHGRVIYTPSFDRMRDEL